MHDIRHRRPLSRILLPHPLHQLDRLFAPDLGETLDRGSAVFLTDGIVDVMLIVAFPGVFLQRQNTALFTTAAVLPFH